MTPAAAPWTPFPGGPALHQSYAEALPELSTAVTGDAPPQARLVVLNEELARELGIPADALTSDDALQILCGHAPGAPTTAQAYAGFQFGSPSPVLGDGRALLLGDLLDAQGRRRDLHLKGSGRTPFSRGGDGKAPLGPMLREHLVSEAMHALGIPTTRALAVVATGERVVRRSPGGEPGAVLARVAASHLRVGTFQYAAWHLGPEVLERLTDYALQRHGAAAGSQRPETADSPALTLLAHVTRAQAKLVAQWMLVGFVHGVMNTDNVTISGETIDYGPCAFLDEYRADAVFSSIDRGGRYAYGRQPDIALWNLSRFGEALLPIIDPEDPDRAVERATAVLETFTPLYEEAWARGMAAKLGIALPGGGSASGASGGSDAGVDSDAGAGGGGRTIAKTQASTEELARALVEVRALGHDLLEILEAAGADFSGFFRALAEDGSAGARRQITDDALPAFDAWSARRDAVRAQATGEERATADAAMLRANPVHIPRNHHLQAALDAAEHGDLTPYERLLEAVTRPFDRREHLSELEGAGDPAGAGDGDPGLGFVTYCGT